MWKGQRSECCHGEGDSVTCRMSDPVWSGRTAGFHRAHASGTRGLPAPTDRRRSSPAALLTAGSAEPAVIWSGSERVSTAISHRASIFFISTKQTVSQRAVDPHKTHTQLLNECIMNTEETFTELIYLHLHNRRAYCVFTSNILKYVLFSDTVILLNVNMAIILYHHSIVCLNNTFDT